MTTMIDPNKRRDTIFLIILTLFMVGIPLATFGYEYGFNRNEVIVIDAYAPENGGFGPDAITAQVGKPVTLRFRSHDVTHGIAIGPGLDVDLGHIDPGHSAEVTLTFDEPGTYTYYCNTWCSPDHWRMRGVIEVHDPANPERQPSPQLDPVIEALFDEGIDIDAGIHTGGEQHEQAFDVKPSLMRGEMLISSLTIPNEFKDAVWRQTHTPAEATDLLAQTNPATSLPDVRDAVAYWWVTEPTSDVIDLYDKNCAACHGQTGDGQGPAAGTTAEDPVAFTDAPHMFDMRSDVLYAKIRRGGMGTDMPNFGTLFTPEETWNLVDYIWWLAFMLDS